MREAGEAKVPLLYPAKNVTTPGPVVTPIFTSAHSPLSSTLVPSEHHDLRIYYTVLIFQGERLSV